MFVQVVIDIAHEKIDRAFCYHVPPTLTVCEGQHVLAPFGRGNTPKEGFVVACSETCTIENCKDILRVLDEYPIFTKEQLDLARWMQRVYHCLFVDALRLMIPAQLRGERVTEKTIHTLSRAKDLSAAQLDSLKRAPKQQQVLSCFTNSDAELTRQDLLGIMENADGAIRALLKKGFLIEHSHNVFRRPPLQAELCGDVVKTLNPQQETAVQALLESMDANRSETFLLHGVTGSGKTEVYLHAIAHCLALSKQAIVLVPEISLTPQTVSRFTARFGGRIAVLHSRLSSGERFDEWRRIRLGLADIVIGARSAIFAPITKLGLIVIDEEHEGSYQSERSPRYAAVEIATKRSAEQRAVLLLGSATPSLTAYYRAINGRYRLLELPNRVLDHPLPKVEVVDMREELLMGNNGIFSERLILLLDRCIKRGEQAMLFLNRRGYSSFVSCRSCGYVLRCDNCDVSMTYHKSERRTRCHYCGAVKPLPTICPQCGRPFIRQIGVGTEQVEEKVKALFPTVSCLRMDADTVTHKDAHAEILSAFAAQRAQVLIGTQMIAKGHDFPHVTLVGIVAADTSLNLPDYRSTERTFQLLTQVAGRAGRDETPGVVVLQTMNASHPVIGFAKRQDYRGFFNYELAERKKCLYPPYSLFLRALYTAADAAALKLHCDTQASLLDKAYRTQLSAEARSSVLLLVSSEAPIIKMQGRFRCQILIKLLRTRCLKEVLDLSYDFFAAESEFRPNIEVNPQEMY